MLDDLGHGLPTVGYTGQIWNAVIVLHMGSEDQDPLHAGLDGMVEAGQPGTYWLDRLRVYRGWRGIRYGNDGDVVNEHLYRFITSRSRCYYERQSPACAFPHSAA